MVGIRTGRAWLGLSGVFAVACGPLVEEQPQYHPLVCGQEAPVQVLATADPFHDFWTVGEVQEGLVVRRFDVQVVDGMRTGVFLADTVGKCGENPVTLPEGLLRRRGRRDGPPRPRPCHQAGACALPFARTQDSRSTYGRIMRVAAGVHVAAARVSSSSLSVCSAFAGNARVHDGHVRRPVCVRQTCGVRWGMRPGGPISEGPSRANATRGSRRPRWAIAMGSRGRRGASCDRMLARGPTMARVSPTVDVAATIGPGPRSTTREPSVGPVAAFDRETAGRTGRVGSMWQTTADRRVRGFRRCRRQVVQEGRRDRFADRST